MAKRAAPDTTCESGSDDEAMSQSFSPPRKRAKMQKRIASASSAGTSTNSQLTDASSMAGISDDDDNDDEDLDVKQIGE
jgi:hypothetical protein